MSNVSWDHSIRQFLLQAGSSSPTPGGGSVAALVAALGASMTSMAGNLSQGEKFAAVQPRIDEAIEKMRGLTAQFEELLQADIVSFDQYIEALKLPKGTDEEKLIRRNTIHEATIHAIEIPFRLIEVCREGLAYTHSIASSCNKNVISDLGIGAILLEAAAQSAVLTVEINLASLKDAELKQQYEKKLSTLLGEIGGLKSKALQITYERIMQ